ncbi:MAG: BamA/TamA family outer membrane protein [Firmicutes bacterium]|nr:BamA/TamA family outer membrane protein [Bacillota bacterium]
MIQALARRSVGAVLAALLVVLAFAGVSSAAPGVIGKVTAIDVDGNQRIDSETILGAVPIKVGDDLTEDAINRAFTAIDALGWFSDLGANTEPYLGGVKLIFMVREFPNLRSVSIAGNQLIGTEELLGLMGSKVNTQVNAATVRKDIQAIGKYYQDKGYWVSIEPTLSDAGDLTIHIVEWTVAEVRVSGNEKTKTKVIQRTIETKPGEHINVNKINNDRRRIYMLGAFENVEAKVEPIQGKHEYSVEFVVTERKTGTANLGVAYSSADGFIGYVEIGDQNFLGNLQRVNVKAEFGGGKSNYQFGFFEPWVGSGKTSMGFNVYSRATEQKLTLEPTAELGQSSEDPSSGEQVKYTQRRKGADFTIGRTLSLNTKAFLKLKLENTINTAADPAFEDQVPEDGITRSLTLSAVNDMRDDLWNPSSGHRLSGSLEYAGGILGGDNNFTKIEAEGSKYVQVADGHILAARLAAGYGFGDLPEQEKFKLGGAGTIRGYKYGDFHGDRMGVLNAEYRFRIVKNLQGVVFCDIGQAWEQGSSFEIGDTKVGYGAGIRVMIPNFGLLRLDYGIGENGGQTYFSFGQSF